ncbi:hypothetical protein BGX27_005926 [Mortierella sp. AM989]|nr:hypothetical protein BGX27_005926 [Mortierella sp. AM989]
MPFPNVATHRRMPHLPNSPKPTNQHSGQEQQQQQQQQQHIQQADHLLQSQAQDPTSSNLRLISGPSTTQRYLEDSQPQTSGTVAARAIQDSDRTHKSLHPEDYSQLHKSSASPLGHLSPSAASSPVMTSHDSKLIKTALHDAFGCLYHPSAHTKHSVSGNVMALRSGDVTPLMGLSPKASPLLRPNLGPSAPITPLELSDEASAAGYFAIHVPSSPASPAMNGSASGSVSARYHAHHYRNTHPSSHLSSTFTSENHDEHSYRPPISLSRRSSMDAILNPAEHPVLSSLQALSLAHDKIPAKEPSSTSLRGESLSTIGTSGVTNTINSTQQVRSLHTSPTSNFFSVDHNEHNSIPGFGHQGLV